MHKVEEDSNIYHVLKEWELIKSFSSKKRAEEYAKKMNRKETNAVSACMELCADGMF